MTQELSTSRLMLMRLLFLVIAVRLGVPVWFELVERGADWDPVQGVAYSFWGALSLLAIVAVRFPEKMLPLLLMHFAYKVIWLAAVGYPLWSAQKLDDPMAQRLMLASLVGVVADLIAIPWPHAFERYLSGFVRIRAISPPVRG